MGLGSLGLYYAVLFAMVAWMAIRVSRVSSGIGIATFICWPIAVIPLITNWGSRDSDIRLPFLVAVLAAGMIMNTWQQAAQNTALLYSAEDIESIRGDDPQFAAQIERDQLRAMGISVEVEPASASAGSAATTFATISMEPGANRRVLSQPQTLTAIPVEGDMQFVAAPPQIRKVPLRELRFRRGQVRLAQAFSRLDVPEHFRFVSAQQLGTLADIRGVAVGDHTLGWLVHERVNLGAPDFWFVDVQFHEVGRLAPPAQATTPILAGASALTWDGERALAIWSVAANDGAARRDVQSAKLTRHGAVVYRLVDLGNDQGELGLRAARLMAARTSTEPGWAYREFTGPESTQSLAAWAEALAAPAAATALAEDEPAEAERRS